MVNGNLGLEAKIDAVVDRSSQRQITKDVEDAISQAEGSVNGGFESRTMPGGGGGAGGATAAGGAGFLSKIGGAGGLLKVAAGGVVFTQMLQAMSAASGRLKSVGTILTTAKDIFFKPFGDFLGELLRPTAKALLDFALDFNKNVSPALVNAASEITGRIGQGIESMDKALGDMASVFSTGAKATWEAVFGPWPGWDNFIDDFPGWGTYLPGLSWDTYADNLDWRMFVPSISWTAYIDDIAWAGFIKGVELAEFVFGVDLDDRFTKMGGWPDVGSLWSQTGGWPDVGQAWNNLGGWPDVSLPDDFWPDLGGFGSAISGVQSALQQFIQWANTLPGINVDPKEKKKRTPPDPCAGVNCPPGQTCIEGRCVGERETPSGCQSDSDCAPGQRCVNGDCVNDPNRGPRPTSTTPTTVGTTSTTTTERVIERRGAENIDVSLSLNGIRLTEGMLQELDAKSTTVSGR